MAAPEHKHQWGMWLGYDPMVIDFGLTNGFCYRRSCQIFGCNAKQQTENLLPDGKFEETNGQG